MQISADDRRRAFSFAEGGRRSGEWMGGGFTGGGGGSAGGGGASGPGWPDPPARKVTPPAHKVAPAHPMLPIKVPAAAAALAKSGVRHVAPAEHFRQVVRNGYEYQIDDRQRTRRVSGALTIGAAEPRSRTAQRQAGGSDRQSGDDGGHYIAHRFNGPSDAFNHFAQDANFNRGGYRALENQWATAKKEGKKVTVRIIPIYEGQSKRPSAIDVLSVIDHSVKTRRFPN